MADKSGIEWTDATWNPLAGCSRVSEGCRHCYAEREAHRLARLGGKVSEKYQGLTVLSTKGEPRWSGEVRLWRDALDQPLRWRRPRRIFVNSMSDLFHESVPDEWIDRIFAVMALCPQHTFQILTKRPKRMLEYISDDVTCRIADCANDMGAGGGYIKMWRERGEFLADVEQWPLPHVWLGVSVEDQRAADERIPLLLQTPAAVRWISAEPLLGPIDLSAWLNPRLYTIHTDGPVSAEVTEALHRVARLAYEQFRGKIHPLNWVVVGGESGPGARPMMSGWVRDIRDQCADAGMPFCFKQWGEWVMGLGARGGFINLMNGINRAWSDVDCQEIGPAGHGYVVCRLGKRKAGRLLDGRTWDEFPATPAVPEVRVAR